MGLLFHVAAGLVYPTIAMWYLQFMRWDTSGLPLCGNQTNIYTPSVCADETLGGSWGQAAD